jgi:hypothetical protein
MNNLFTQTDASILAVIIAALMCGGWAFGCWRTRRVEQKEGGDAVSQLSNASVALLGLLLAFTFSMSLERHELRREMMVRHANTIGDFATCAALLNEPVSGQLRTVVRRYVDHLVGARRADITEAELQQVLAEDERLHNEMQTLVKQAVDNGTPIAVSLVNTLNDVTSSHEDRLAAMRNQLPASIVLLLGLSAVVAMVQIGMQHGRLDERELVTGIGFILLVSLCIWVTLDLNQPLSGTITVSHEPMLRLQNSLNQ